jgi:hypothetical protein
VTTYEGRRSDDEVAQVLGAPLGPPPHRFDPHLDHQLERDPKPYIWHKTSDEILDSLAPSLPADL